MPAQIGSAVFLQYGNQGSQQPGNVVLLSYDLATDATTRSIRSGAVGKWVAAAHEVVGLLAPQSATARNERRWSRNCPKRFSAAHNAAKPWPATMRPGMFFCFRA